jgi:hypothetical protein
MKFHGVKKKTLGHANASKHKCCPRHQLNFPFGIGVPDPGHNMDAKPLLQTGAPFKRLLESLLQVLGIFLQSPRRPGNDATHLHTSTGERHLHDPKAI